MRNTSMEQIGQQYCEEGEIDLCQCFKVIAKRKKTFFAVFLFVLVVGIWCFLASPKIYRISVLLQQPSFGQVLSGDDGLKLAQDLKGLITSHYFKEVLKKRLNLDLDKKHMKFNVAVPDKTEMLKVSVELPDKEKGSGVAILQNLVELVSESYAQRLQIEEIDISRRMKFKENVIASAKEKARNLETQAREIAGKQAELSQERELVNISSAQILEKREGLLKANSGTEDAYTLLLANQVKNNSIYLNEVNNQIGKLSLRKEQLGFELKSIDSQIRNFQAEAENLRVRINYPSSLKIVSPPEISSLPVRTKENKTLVLFLMMAVFSGALAVFVQESRSRRFKKDE